MGHSQSHPPVENGFALGASENNYGSLAVMSLDKVDDGGELDGGGSPVLQLCQRTRISLLSSNHGEVVDDKVQMTNPSLHRLLNRMQNLGVPGSDLREEEERGLGGRELR